MCADKELRHVARESESERVHCVWHLAVSRKSMLPAAATTTTTTINTTTITTTTEAQTTAFTWCWSSLDRSSPQGAVEFSYVLSAFLFSYSLIVSSEPQFKFISPKIARRKFLCALLCLRFYGRLAGSCHKLNGTAIKAKSIWAWNRFSFHSFLHLSPFCSQSINPQAVSELHLQPQHLHCNRL